VADVIVRATALRWASDDFPGWIEVSLTDADGQDHRIIEKVPVLTTVDLGPWSPLPLEFWLRAYAREVNTDRVRIEFASAVATTDGLTGVDASLSDVVWL
jgi:hypothetical protein